MSSVVEIDVVEIDVAHGVGIEVLKTGNQC